MHLTLPAPVRDLCTAVAFQGAMFGSVHWSSLLLAFDSVHDSGGDRSLSGDMMGSESYWVLILQGRKPRRPLAVMWFHGLPRGRRRGLASAVAVGAGRPQLAGLQPRPAAVHTSREATRPSSALPSSLGRPQAEHLTHISRANRYLSSRLGWHFHVPCCRLETWERLSTPHSPIKTHPVSCWFFRIYLESILPPSH